MKKMLLIMGLAMIAITMVTGSAMAFFLVDGGADVGAVDSLIDETNLPNSGEAAELAWVSQVLGYDAVFTYKDESLENEWEAIVGEVDIFAHALASNPDYFLIKTGNVTVDGNTHFLLENLAGPGVDWAVVDLGILRFTNITNITGVSHISEFDANPVPEPATILLLGSGLAGLAGIGRKKKVKK